MLPRAATRKHSGSDGGRKLARLLARLLARVVRRAGDRARRAARTDAGEPPGWPVPVTRRARWRGRWPAAASCPASTVRGHGIAFVLGNCPFVGAAARTPSARPAPAWPRDRPKGSAAWYTAAGGQGRPPRGLPPRRAARTSGGGYWHARAVPAGTERGAGTGQSGHRYPAAPRRSPPARGDDPGGTVMTSEQPSRHDDVPGRDRLAAASGHTQDDEPAGGEPACWAHLVCPECGAMASGEHREGCGSGPAAPAAR